jgi:hypothetical protein
VGTGTHLIIPDYKTILYVHTFFIAFIVLLMGLLCLGYSHELIYDPFGRVICLGLFGFWLTRLIFVFTEGLEGQEI